MANVLVTAFLIVAVGFTSVRPQATFCYNSASCGPGSSLWGGLCMTGREQSPIELPSFWTTPLLLSTNTITFNDAYKQNIPAPRIINNGHTVQVSANTGLTSNMCFTSTVTGADSYCFGQMHCHWGAEHQFSIRYRPNIECHIVHYNQRYGSISAAVASGQRGALAIFGIFYTISSTQLPLDIVKPDPTFELFLRNIPKVVSPLVGSQPMDGVVNIYNMIPRVTTPAGMLNFFPKYQLQAYHYMGSLTTPPCAQGMHWFVMRQIRQISVQQLQAFKSLLDEELVPLVNNYRPLQPLNGRVVQQLVINEVNPTTTPAVLSPAGSWFNNKFPFPSLFG